MLKDNIKKRRKELNMTLLEVADALGITEATMQRYESGTIKNIPYENIEKISSVLNCTPQFLMGWSKYPKEPDDIGLSDYLSEHEISVITAYRNNPAMQDAVDKLLNVDDEIIASDIAQTIKSASKKGISVPTDKK